MENTRGQIHSGLKTLASVLATQAWQGFRMWQLKEAAASLVPTNHLVPRAGEWGRGRMKRKLEGPVGVCSLLEPLAGTLDPDRGVHRACKGQSRWVAALSSSCLDINPCTSLQQLFECHPGWQINLFFIFKKILKSFSWEKKKKPNFCCC